LWWKSDVVLVEIWGGAAVAAAAALAML